MRRSLAWFLDLIMGLIVALLILCLNIRVTRKEVG